MMPKISTNGAQLVWGKGEIACYEQFILVPQCFQKDSVVSKSVSME